MTWAMPTKSEQEKHLKEQEITAGSTVIYGAYGKTLWEVKLIYEIGENAICVLLKSKKSGITRTAWPWELRGI